MMELTLPRPTSMLPRLLPGVHCSEQKCCSKHRPRTFNVYQGGGGVRQECCGNDKILQKSRGHGKQSAESRVRCSHSCLHRRQDQQGLGRACQGEGNKRLRESASAGPPG